MNKITGDEPATGFAIPGDEKAGWHPESVPGLTIRQHFAAMRKEPIFGNETLSLNWAEAIMGSKCPVFDEDRLLNVKWWIAAHERVSVMRSDALIAELNKPAP